MTKLRPYFDAPTLTLLLLDHDERQLMRLADLVGDSFAPEKLLRAPAAFDLLRSAVAAWCERNSMTPGNYIHDHETGLAAIVAIGRYLQDGAVPEVVTADRLAGSYLANPSRYPEAEKYFASVRRHIEVFAYERKKALKASGTKTAMRQIAYAYGESEGFDGVASICPAIRHEAAGLILDSLEKSFDPALF